MKIQKGTALWRGIIAAAVGFVAMLCLMLALGQFSFLYLLAGPFYGFGFAFANWHVVMQKTKQGAIQGAAVFGIGLVLSHWLKDQRYGMWGWLFFVFRVSWHLGFCWIPGIWYGIQAIREEARGTAPASVSAEDLEARQLDQQRIARAAAIQAAQRAAASAPQPAPVPQAVPVSRPAAVPRPAPIPQPAAPSKQTQPSLDCVAGAFAGARFPVSPGEIISLGSDPALCQIVLPQPFAASRHCSLLYNLSRGCWQAKDLSGGLTYINGIQPLSSGAFQDLPQGAVLCVGQGKNSQRFHLQ